MDSFFQFISSNTLLANTLFTLLSLVLLSVIAIYCVAFAQGRSISFWPPKIGERPKRSLRARTHHAFEAGTVQPDQPPHVAFISAKELERMDPMVDLIERSEHLFLAGVVLSHATQRHRAQIEAQLAKGSRFRFLVLDPDSPDVDAIAKSFDLLPNQVRDDIRATLRDIEILGNKTLAGQTGSVEVRLLCREPSFSFALSNPESQKGYFCAGLRAYGHRSTTRPHFVLRAPDNWFYYFKENCEALWAAAAPWHGDPKAIKPVAQKAGVVPYRLSREGQTEVAVITARANPARWIFPVGDVNRGETLSEAAARECQEESGCVVEIVSKLGLLEFDVGDVISRMTFFAGLVKRETSYQEKDRQLKWVKLPELAQTVADDFKALAQAATASLATASQRREVAQQDKD